MSLYMINYILLGIWCILVALIIYAYRWDDKPQQTQDSDEDI